MTIARSMPSMPPPGLGCPGPGLTWGEIWWDMETTTTTWPKNNWRWHQMAIFGCLWIWLDLDQMLAEFTQNGEMVSTDRNFPYNLPCNGGSGFETKNNWCTSTGVFPTSDHCRMRDSDSHWQSDILQIETSQNSKASSTNCLTVRHFADWN